MRVSYRCSLINKSKHRKTAVTLTAVNSKTNYFFNCSHFWFATEQEVLDADWQDVWHSPQPPFFADSQRFLELNVLILFI